MTSSNRRLGFFIVVLLLISFCCVAQQKKESYKERSERTIEGLEKFPIEARFASTFHRSNKTIIDLADTLTFDLMRSGIQVPFTFLSSDSRTERFFKDIVHLRMLAMTGVKDLKLKSQITVKFSGMIVSEVFDDWLEKVFKDKSRVQVVATFREMQASCLQIEDLVFAGFGIED